MLKIEILMNFICFVTMWDPMGAKISKRYILNVMNSQLYDLSLNEIVIVVRLMTRE